MNDDGVDIEDESRPRRRPRRVGPYKRSGDKITIRFSETQSALLTEFSVEFGLNATETVRACMAACFGLDVWLGPDDKMAVHRAAKFLVEGGVIEGEVD